MEAETKNKKGLHFLNTAIVAVLLVSAIGCAAYIMFFHIGLADSLDFGAGAYYYADIPGFDRFVNGTHYTSETPMWVLILLFLAWGALMYKFWIWIDKVLK